MSLILPIAARWLVSPQPIESNWARLHFLMLRLTVEFETIKTTLETLKGFHPPRLKNVVLHLHSSHIGEFMEKIIRFEEDDAHLCLNLDQALLQFSHPSISFFLTTAVQSRGGAFWINKLGQHFPTLQNCGSLTIVSKPGWCYHK